MTIRELIELAKYEGYSLDTIIYHPLGANVKHVKFTKDTDGNDCVVLDESPIDDDWKESTIWSNLLRTIQRWYFSYYVS